MSELSQFGSNSQLSLRISRNDGLSNDAFIDRRINVSKQIDFPYRETKVSVRRLVALGTLSGVAVLSGVAIASASTTQSSTPKSHPLHARAGLHRARPVVDGKVTGLGTGSFTVLDKSSKSYTVTVTGTTTYKEHNVSSVGIGDVKAGTFVDVLGSVSGTDVTATKVRIETQERPASPMRPMGVRPDAAGKITALGTKSFTIQDRAGRSISVDVTGSTTFDEPGATSPSFGSIKVGDFAAVSGTITGSTIDATDVHFGDRHPLGGHMGAPDFRHMPAMPGGPMGAPEM